MSRPTPLDEAPRLAASAGVERLWIKREDLAGSGLGGNKIRQIEVLLADALAVGADTVITTAGVESNFCRALAGCAGKAGLRCHLLLRGEPGAALTGNLLLDRLFGAEVDFIPQLDPWSTAVVDLLEATAERHRAAGRTPAILHLPGRSAARAASAWVDGAAELVRQWQVLGCMPRHLVLAAGSGLTAAGLALGLRHLGAPCRVYVASVQQPADRLATWIVRVADDTAARLGLSMRLTAADFDMDDSQIGPGYGVPSPASLGAVRLAAQCEGLVLDPVYTGKAMAALLAAAPGRIAGEAVFLHSGGLPGLFAAAHTLAAHLEAP